MEERTDDERLGTDAERRLDGYLFGLIESRELHFPKGIIHPRGASAEPALAGRGLSSPPVGWIYRAGRWLLQPAVAYALVLGLLYPAYLGVVRKPQIVKETVEVPKVTKEVVKEFVPQREIVEVARPVAGATIEDIVLDRKVERDGSGGSDPVLSVSSDLVRLSFFIPVEMNPDIRYDLELRDGRGVPVQKKRNIVSHDGIGNFALAYSQALFKSDRYVLIVRKVRRTTSEVLDAYRFQFRLKVNPR